MRFRGTLAAGWFVPESSRVANRGWAARQPRRWPQAAVDGLDTASIDGVRRIEKKECQKSCDGNDACDDASRRDRVDLAQVGLEGKDGKAQREKMKEKSSAGLKPKGFGCKGGNHSVKCIQ